MVKLLLNKKKLYLKTERSNQLTGRQRKTIISTKQKQHNMVVGSQIGGIGNCMFVIATVIAHAKKWGMDYSISKKNINPHHKDLPQYFFKNVNYSDRELKLPIYLEPSFTYTEIPYMKHLCLQGYFQSWRYFDEYWDEIIKAFGFDGLPTNDDFVSIHIRRTDYLLYPNHHPVITLEYIKKAVSLFEGDYSFHIFSDDIGWAKENLTKDVFNGHDYEFKETGDDLLDLKYMATAEHNIISNSSYSWWAAYLNPNPNKKVIAPSVWFGKDLNHSTKDLYYPTWTII